MGSQQDLDQGGTFRQWDNVYMGPSVGWQRQPKTSILTITTVGATLLNRSTTLVKITAINDAVNITLPSSLASPAGAQALPGQFVITPVTVVDIGGLAGTAPAIYTIFGQPGELISGLVGVQLA